MLEQRGQFVVVTRARRGEPAHQIEVREPPVGAGNHRDEPPPFDQGAVDRAAFLGCADRGRPIEVLAAKEEVGMVIGAIQVQQGPSDVAGDATGQLDRPRRPDVRIENGESLGLGTEVLSRDGPPAKCCDSAPDLDVFIEQDRLGEHGRVEPALEHSAAAPKNPLASVLNIPHEAKPGGEGGRGLEGVVRHAGHVLPSLVEDDLPGWKFFPIDPDPDLDLDIGRHQPSILDKRADGRRGKAGFFLGAGHL